LIFTAELHILYCIPPLIWGLRKTWTLDWTELWTGLTKTAIYRQRTPPRLQQFVSSSASSCCWGIISLISVRSKVTCIIF